MNPTAGGNRRGCRGHAGTAIAAVLMLLALALALAAVAPVQAIEPEPAPGHDDALKARGRGEIKSLEQILEADSWARREAI